MGVTIPAEWGGAGLDYVSYALAIEAMASASAVVAVIAPSTTRWSPNQLRSSALRRRSRPGCAGSPGESLGAFALSEEHAGSDAANQQIGGAS